MNVLKSLDWWAGVSYISLGGLGAVSTAMAVFFPSHATNIVQGAAMIVAAAGLLTRLHRNPTPTTPTPQITPTQE